MDNKDFIRQDNNYRTLKAFQKAECVYDVTYYFANKFLAKGDRTIDQMVQAARSGKQNLIHQCDVLIKGLIEWQKKNFLENGGIKEEMYRARKAYRDNNGFNGQNGANGQNKY